jgi:hypothetical protein
MERSVVGARELKTRLDTHLRRVEAGDPFEDWPEIVEGREDCSLRASTPL